MITAILIGAAVGVLANGISNAIIGKDFFDNWGRAALMGALGGGIAGFGSSIGAGLVDASMSVASSYLPSANIPIGENFSISLSPAIVFGSQGFSIGANVGFNFSTPVGGFGVNTNFGYTNMGLGSNTVKGWNTNISAGVTLGNEKWNVGWTASAHQGAGISQTTGGIRATLGGVRLAYENDGAPMYEWGLNVNDGGDRWRTAAVSIGYGDFDVGLNMFTGEPNGVPTPKGTDGYIEGYHTGDANMFRLGALSLGYGGYRVGWNSEGIRHVFQNKFAHGVVKPQPYFKVLSGRGSLYTQYSSFSNPNSLWSF